MQKLFETFYTPFGMNNFYAKPMFANIRRKYNRENKKKYGRRRIDGYVRSMK